MVKWQPSWNSGKIFSEFHDSSVKTVQSKGEFGFCLLSFCAVESFLVAKVSIGEKGEHHSEALTSIRPHCKAGFEPGLPASKVVDHTAQLP